MLPGLGQASSRERRAAAALGPPEKVRRAIERDDENMTDDNEHSACVDAWMDRAAKGLPPAQLVQAFERGFTVVWQRAHQTLGDVTLTAIVDRVLYTAVERHPILAPLGIEDARLQCHALEERAGTLQRDELAGGLRFVLVELLTVLGNLTADILTPSLHAELSKVAAEERASGEGAPHEEPPTARMDGEDAKS